MIDEGHHLASDGVGAGQRLGDRADVSALNPGGGQDLDPVRRGGLGDPLGDQTLEFLTMPHSIFVAGEAEVGGPLGVVEDLAQGSKLNVVPHADGYVTIGCGECPVRDDVGVTVSVALRRFTGDEVVRGDRGEHLQAGVVKVHFGVLATAGGVPCLDGRQDRDRGEQPNAEIDDGNTKLHRPAIGLTGDRHQPTLRLCDEVVTELAGTGTTAAVSTDRASDGSWSVFGIPIVVEPPAAECA